MKRLFKSVGAVLSLLGVYICNLKALAAGDATLATMPATGEVIAFWVILGIIVAAVILIVAMAIIKKRKK